MVEALSRGEWNRYPDATAALVRDKLGAQLGVSPDWIVVGAGSVALLQQFILAAAGPGDEVVYPWRSFEAYPGLVVVAGATSRRVALDAGFRHDVDALAGALTDQTRVVIVCSPNNPTSTVVTTDEFVALMEAIPSDRLVILDEAYREFVTDPHAVRGEEHWDRYPNLVVMRTFSKAYGLAGLRIGYAVGRPELLAPAQATAIPLAVSAPAQIAAAVSLDHQSEIDRRVHEVVQRIGRVRDGLAELADVIPVPHGNFVWLPTGAHTDEVAGWLEEVGVVGRVFAGEGIRVSIAEEEGVEALLRIARRVVHDLPKTPPQPRLG